jgi:hypothetical protein
VAFVDFYNTYFLFLQRQQKNIFQSHPSLTSGTTCISDKYPGKSVHEIIIVDDGFYDGKGIYF